MTPSAFAGSFTLPPWPELPLDPAHDPVTREFLGVLQGNILRPHGHAWQRLVTFTLPADAGATRAWLRAAGARWVTSALAQEEARAPAPGGQDAAPAQVLYSLWLAPAALTTPGLAAERGAKFPQTFRAGMSRCLSEPDDGLPEDPATWHAPWREVGTFHGAWLLAADDRAALDTATAELAAWSAPHGITLHTAAAEDTHEWRDAAGGPREPFGFREGLAQPPFFSRRSADEPGRDWTELTLDHALLRTDGPGRLLGASFVAVRKFEQDVRAFRAYEQVAGARLAAAGWDPALAGALLVGRTRAGQPVHLAAAQRTLPAGTEDAFDFSADPAGDACPWHAHIRKMNTRSHTSPHAESRSAIRRMQLVRRSTVWDPAGALAGHDPEDAAAPWPAGGVGLLFTSYQADVGQFLTLYRDWAHAKHFPHPHSQHRDPLLFGGDAPWTWRGIELPPPPQCMTVRGGEWFFVPTLPWLATV